MLYLEDYLEMIEHLPQELRDRFTEMRELDLSVQNNMDDLEKRVKVLFNEWKRNPNDLPPTADLEFEGIKKEYCKTLEDQDEKVVLANQMYELVDRYLRRLDTELHKFKCELEADNKGITELLEKRSLELDTPITSTTSSQKENRYERYSSSSSSRPREKRRSDSCQASGGVCYPEKRPHLSHSLSLGEPRLAMGVTNGNNVLLASQLQGHTLHGITQSQQLVAANASNNSSTTPMLHTSSNNSYHHTSASMNNSSNQSSNLSQQQQQQHSSATTTMLTSTSSNVHISNQLINSTNQSAISLNTLSTTPSIINNQQQTSQQSSNATTASLAVANAHVTVGAASAANAPSNASSGAGYTLVTGGAGPAIAAAASQAIAATQKMQQGRRTPSLKASYEAINSTGSGGLMKVNDMAIGRELAGAAQTAIQAIQHDSNKKKANKKYSSSSSSHHSGSSSLRQQSMGATTSSSMGVTSTSSQSLHHHQMDLVGDVDGGYIDMGSAGVEELGGGGAVEAAAEDLGVGGEYIDSYDPNEPRYCLCNQVSYGDMVACDNEDCPSEWFHYPCVGITAPPKGKWYCPQCTSSMRRRGSRKN